MITYMCAKGDDAVAWLYYPPTLCLWKNIKFNKNNLRQLLLQERKLQLRFLSLAHAIFFKTRVNKLKLIMSHIHRRQLCLSRRWGLLGRLQMQSVITNITLSSLTDCYLMCNICNTVPSVVTQHHFVKAVWPLATWPSSTLHEHFWIFKYRCFKYPSKDKNRSFSFFFLKL
jgi:hypothetical protein